MVRIKLIPLEGIVIDSVGEVKLGWAKDQVETALGLPRSVDGKRCFYDQYEFRLDYDEENNLEFIEFIYGPFPEKSEPELFGIKPFSTEAKQLIALLAEENKGYIDTSEADHSFAFQEISVGVWRPLTPENVEEVIKESKELGEFETAKQRLEQELEQSQYFWTIGIGVKNYYGLP